MANNRRRSDRIMLTIPLRVHGTDLHGVRFKEDGRTVILNRHGARIQIARRLQNGEVVRLVNLIGQREADFTVIGPVSPLTEKGGEYGMELVDAKDNIWGIHFPPIDEGGGLDSKALMECRRCHEAALLPLSLVQVEVLETSGLLTKSCHHCGVSTPWGYAEKQVAMGGSPGEAAAIADAQAAATGADLRRHRRVSLQLPALVRDYYGGVEVTKSENVSKGGFCFASEKNYLIGQGLQVVCPYNPSASNIETRARIVRRHEVEGTNRKVYGVRYTPQSA